MFTTTEKNIVLKIFSFWKLCPNGALGWSPECGSLHPSIYLFHPPRKMHSHRHTWENTGWKWWKWDWRWKWNHHSDATIEKERERERERESKWKRPTNGNPKEEIENWKLVPAPCVCVDRVWWRKLMRRWGEKCTRLVILLSFCFTITTTTTTVVN